MRGTLIVHVHSLLEQCSSTRKLIDGKWVPARSESFNSWRYRLKATWMVFTGKADALVWHKQ